MKFDFKFTLGWLIGNSWKWSIGFFPGIGLIPFYIILCITVYYILFLFLFPFYIKTDILIHWLFNNFSQKTKLILLNNPLNKQKNRLV